MEKEGEYLRSCVHKEITTTTAATNTTNNTVTASRRTADGREHTSLVKEKRRISISRTNKSLEVIA